MLTVLTQINSELMLFQVNSMMNTMKSKHEQENCGDLKNSQSRQNGENNLHSTLDRGKTQSCKVLV